MPSSELLVSHLVAPPSFVNVSSGSEAGAYVFGNGDFRVRSDVRVAPLAHRSFGGAKEDLVLGVISVLLIALLSEIVQTVLLRRAAARARPARGGVRAAYALDEVSHFRNVWSLVRARHGAGGGSATRGLAFRSLLILAVAAALLAAEVIAVYLTQPYRLYSSESQYNLRGVQPAGTALDVASKIDLVTAEKTCITPSMMHSNQTREYTLSACVMRETNPALTGLYDEATSVNVSSWFHRAGSDHTVDYGNGDQRGSFKVNQRALLMKGQSGMSKAILFDTVEGHVESCTYLQKYMMYMAMQWSCDQESADRTCTEMKDELKFHGPKKVFRNELKVWEYRNTSEAGFLGFKMHFTIKLKQPHDALKSALHVLTTSAVIYEVPGPGLYFDVSAEKEQHGIEGLLSEEGRIAGVVLLASILGALSVVLVVLRCCLRPVSLARIARDAIDDAYDLEMPPEPFLPAGARAYASHDAFDLSLPESDLASSDTPASTSSLKKLLCFARAKWTRAKPRVTDDAGAEAPREEYDSAGTSDGERHWGER